MAIANLTKKNRKLIFSGLDKTIAMYDAIQPNCGWTKWHCCTQI
jgi:hypothetical protein